MSSYQKCEDFSPDTDCTKFIRCFHNLRVKFTCADGTAWEKDLKTCVHKEWVESCNTKAKIANEVDYTEDNSDLLTIEADEDALSNFTLSRSLSDARASGPIVTPKQFGCPTYCSNGATTNMCSPNPCLNGGVCINVNPGFRCQCPTSFTGNRCEAPAGYTGVTCQVRPDPCASQPCRNGGRCLTNGNGFLCQCPSGYYGVCCEFRSFCQPNPCNNGGVCTQTSTGYVCACQTPFTGSNCQTGKPTCVSTCPSTVVVYNPCLPNPCQNQGGCAVQSNAVHCWCPDAYYGFYCQYARSRLLKSSGQCDIKCLNGGKCYIDEKKGPACSCSKEFYGEKCEFVERSANYKYCPLDCQNGGTCVYIGTTPSCRCPTGRKGRLCQTRTSAKITALESDMEDVADVPIESDSQTEDLTI
ncbi:unnamed protein product [Didymodactylos carnosus]|uniref:Uncharacterized protein n=1 Tax=Didymodactylos carnosus TaxID=1234261 RepID=A0A8S2NK73_9BILA|nr:unnamed protein product [Didymodactylos carnosus]CAF4005516.1 unnamed protein product [Didymodactylos carnosus]